MKAKNILAALILILTTTSAHAGQRNDINLYLALEDAGASLEQAMGSTYIGVRDLYCVRENVYSPFHCEMVDQGIQNYGQKINVSPNKVDAILGAIPNLEQAWNVMSRYEFQIESITCKLPAADLIDIHEGEKASCTIQIAE